MSEGGKSCELCGNALEEVGSFTASPTQALEFCVPCNQWHLDGETSLNPAEVAQRKLRFSSSVKVTIKERGRQLGLGKFAKTYNRS